MIEKLIGIDAAAPAIRAPVLHVMHEAKGAVSGRTRTAPRRDRWGVARIWRN